MDADMRVTSWPRETMRTVAILRVRGQSYGLVNGGAPGEVDEIKVIFFSSSTNELDVVATVLGSAIAALYFSFAMLFGIVENVQQESLKLQQTRSDKRFVYEHMIDRIRSKQIGSISEALLCLHARCS